MEGERYLDTKFPCNHIDGMIVATWCKRRVEMASEVRRDEQDAWGEVGMKGSCRWAGRGWWQGDD